VRRLRFSLPLIAALVVAVLPLAADADGVWLDGPRDPWNTPGMAVPAARGEPEEVQEICARFLRPPETAEDEAFAAAGWHLDGPYQRGWGVTLVGGTVGFDGMCRPLGYQRFVFVDGAFAGTLSPGPMASRTDGALGDAGVAEAGRVWARFARYAPDDPLCCPSGETLVQFAIVRTAAGPVLNPEPA